MSNRPYEATYEPRPGDQARDEELRYQRFLSALQRAGLGAPRRVESLAVTILGALEQRLSGAEARDLNEELPWPLRDQLRKFERDPRGRPERFRREELLRRVGEELGLEPGEAEHAVRTVLQHARQLLSEKEGSDVADQLPRDMQDLWVPAA